MFSCPIVCVLQEKERALQGAMEMACGEQRPSPPPEPAEEEEESAPDGEPGRLLEWPQLELERVNSFLTSRLEEIKNTIKDSIRASFSMYDLNLDVNDFPKKAATLEGNHLLSHLNGSSDLQQIDLDLAPLSLRNFKRDLDTLNGWEDTTNGSSTTTTSISAASAKDVQRLHATPNLSKLIRVHSPERGSPPGSEATQASSAPAPKPKDEAPDGKNATGVGAKTKKGKKQQQRQQQQQDQASQEPPAVSRSNKATAGTQEKTLESRAAETERGSRGGSKASQQSQQHGESQKTGNKKTEEGKASKHNSNGAANGSHHSSSNLHRRNGDAETRGNRSEHEADAKTNSLANSNSQQPKGKTKKNKSKTDKSSGAIGNVTL